MIHISLTYNNPFQSRFCCLTCSEGVLASITVIFFLKTNLFYQISRIRLVCI